MIRGVPRGKTYPGPHHSASAATIINVTRKTRPHRRSWTGTTHGWLARQQRPTDQCQHRALKRVHWPDDRRLFGRQPKIWYGQHHANALFSVAQIVPPAVST